MQPSYYPYQNYYLAPPNAGQLGLPNHVGVYPMNHQFIHPQNLMFNPFCIPMQAFSGGPDRSRGGELTRPEYDSLCDFFQSMDTSYKSDCDLPDWLYDDNGNIGVDLKDIISSELFFTCLKDKRGSRFIQDHFPSAGSTLRSQVYEVLLQRHAFYDVALDRYGNFVLQRIIEHLEPELRQTVIELVSQCSVQLSIDRFLCRVVQKVLDEFPIDDLHVLLDGFQGFIVQMALDQSANHVLQKTNKLFPKDDLAFLAVELTQNMDQAICNKFGCRVIQLLLEKFCVDLTEAYPVQGDKKDSLRMILDKIASRQKYCQDEFANYVVQYILTHKYLQKYAQLIVDKCVRKNIICYATEKFASHVVEKALDVVDDHVLDEMVHELFKKQCGRSGKLAIEKMLFDQYGNYVIQRLLSIAIEIHHGKRKSSLTWFNRLSDTIIENAPGLLTFSSPGGVSNSVQKDDVKVPRKVRGSAVENRASAPPKKKRRAAGAADGSGSDSETEHKQNRSEHYLDKDDDDDDEDKPPVLSVQKQTEDKDLDSDDSEQPPTLSPHFGEIQPQEAEQK